MSNHVFNTKKTTLKAAVDFILTKKSEDLVDFSLVGRWLYLALKKEEKIYVVSCRFFKELNENQWKLEWYPSDNPPQQYDCPEKILKLINPIEELSQLWINKCRDKKSEKSKNRNTNKQKFDLINLNLRKKIKLTIDGKVFLLKGFYMNSKNELILENIKSKALVRYKLSLLSYEDIELSLNKT
jgi:hypothetical protein